MQKENSLRKRPIRDVIRMLSTLSLADDLHGQGFYFLIGDSVPKPLAERKQPPLRPQTLSNRMLFILIPSL